MKNSWNIFRADWRRLTASVVAVVVMLGLCLVPCLYAWFNILSNWDPYGVGSTSRIKVAVSNEALRAQLETAIAGLEKLDAAVDELSLSGVKEPVRDALAEVREALRMSRPLLMMATLSHSFSATSSTWVEKKMAPPSSQTCRIMVLSRWDALGSSPTKGSSMMMSFGSWSHAAMMESFCFMPWE